MVTVAEQLKLHREQKTQQNAAPLHQRAPKRPSVAEQLNAHRAKRDRQYESDQLATTLAPPRADAGSDYVHPMPEAPTGYDERNPAKPPKQHSGPLDDFTRGLQIGTQGVGRGVAGIAGLPIDLAEMGLNLGSFLAEGTANKLGGDVSLPRFSNSAGGSNAIANKSADLTEAFLGNSAIIDPEEMTPDERVGYRVNQFATEGAVGSSLISRLRQFLPRSLTAPYEASGSEARILAGDTAAGAGSGVGMGAYDEYMPEGIKDALGVFGELLAGLGGGIGGATSLHLGEGIKNAGQRSATKKLNMPEGDVPRDPITQMPISRKDYGNAAQFFKDTFRNEKDFESAKARLEDYLANLDADGSVGPGPHPTTALILDDPSQLAMERKARATDSAPFISADRAVMGDVSSKIGSVRPEGAAPDAAIDLAAVLAEQKRGAAATKVEGAQSNIDELAAANDDITTTLSMGRTKDEASRDLDQVLVEGTYGPARDQKNALYDAAAADPDVVVGTENTRAAAGAVTERVNRANPVLRDGESSKVAAAFEYPKTPDIPDGLPSIDIEPDPRVVRPLGDVMVDRQSLSTTESEARAKGNFGKADAMREIRKGINDDVRAAADSGVPGSEKLAAADSYYREQFAPFFRDGNASPDFFKNVDRDPARGRVPPEATADKFLRTGATSRAAADDIARILEISPNGAEGVQAVRDYLIADAVSKGLVRKNAISETLLARYMSQREGIFSQFPDIKTEFDGLLASARNSKSKGNALAAELRNAETAARLTDKQINTGVLGLLIDHAPDKAVAAVFASKDPSGRMKELITEFSGNKAAIDGWKAAVSDYMHQKVTTASKAAVSDGSDVTSLPAARRMFETNQKALSEVFNPEEMQTLQQAQTRLEILSKRGAQASTGSATAENFGGLRAVIGAFANPVGSIVMLKRGALMAGSVERRIKMVADQFPDAGRGARIILDRVRFDPVLAKHLMDFPTSDAQIYTWTKKLNQLLVVGGVEGNAAE